MGVQNQDSEFIEKYARWQPKAPFQKRCKRDGCLAMTNSSGYCPNHYKQMTKLSLPPELAKEKRRLRESVKKKRMKY